MNNSQENQTIINLEGQIRDNKHRARRNMRKNRELLKYVQKLEAQLAALTPKTATEPEIVLPVRLHMLLDRSGSMSGFAEDVIGGFNAFVDKQRAIEGECYLNLVQFDSDDPFQVIYDNVSLNQVEQLTSQVYYPRGMTPLYDALGSLIARGEKLQNQNPADNVVWVFTDGLENASTEYSAANVKALVEQKEKEGWTFTFMGCDIDSYEASAEIGFRQTNTSNFKKDQDGYDMAWSEIDRGLTSYREKNSYDRNSMSEDFWEGQKNAEEDLLQRS
ncbi:MAG: VWA domain-containing protein [Acidimicrobiales bacterium]|nr:VWA domain-containing protein [Acidimicrobiales bacterium]